MAKQQVIELLGSPVLLVALLFGLKLLSDLYSLLYNIYFSPFAKFPGPRLAGASPWWKISVEVWQGKNMIDVLPGLHERYGGIVRIGPNELHFSEPSAYYEIYSAKNRWNKEPSLYQCFGEDRSSFGFLTYHEAKERKDVLAPLFSTRAVQNMQHLIQEKLSALTAVLDSHSRSSTPVNLGLAFRAFTIDVITSFCFSRSVSALSAPHFASPILLAMDAFTGGLVFTRSFPLLRKLIFASPPWILKVLNPQTAGMERLQAILGKQVREVSSNPEKLEMEGGHRIIYHELLKERVGKNGERLPAPEPGSLYEEAQALLFGGTDTVGVTLMIGVSCLSGDKNVEEKLRREIMTVWKDRSHEIRLEELEKLPYLTAVIKESLRISPGVCGLLTRIVPPEGAEIAGHHVPGGAIVSSSSFLIHRNPTIFPNPDRFDPDRWLVNAAQSLDGSIDGDPRDNTSNSVVDGKATNAAASATSPLDKWLVAFSRGPRACLGINLAWAELYLAFATMFRLFEFNVDGSQSPKFTDCFLPSFTEDVPTARIKKVED